MLLVHANLRKVVAFRFSKCPSSESNSSVLYRKSNRRAIWLTFADRLSCLHLNLFIACQESVFQCFGVHAQSCQPTQCATLTLVAM